MMGHLTMTAVATEVVRRTEDVDHDAHPGAADATSGLSRKPNQDLEDLRRRARPHRFAIQESAVTCTLLKVDATRFWDHLAHPAVFQSVKAPSSDAFHAVKGESERLKTSQRRGSQRTSLQPNFDDPRVSQIKRDTGLSSTGGK